MMIILHFRGGGPLDGGTVMVHMGEPFYVHPVSIGNNISGKRREWDELYARVGPIPADKLDPSDKRDGNRHLWYHYAGQRAPENRPGRGQP
jgi:hypothetical protein